MTTGAAPDLAPQGPSAIATAAARAATLVIGIEGIVLLVVAGGFLVELGRGEGSEASAVVSEAVLIAVMGVLLLVLARGWARRRRWVSTPTVVWSVLLVPAAVGMLQNDVAIQGVPLLVLAVVGAVAGVVGSGALSARTSR